MLHLQELVLDELFYYVIKRITIKSNEILFIYAET